MHRWKTPLICIVATFGGVAGQDAAAQTDLSRFSLAKAAPADTFILVAARTNSERAFLDEYWGEVHQAFMDSGILSDIWEMVSDKVPDEALDEFEEVSERVGELCGKVQWCSLFEKEFVHIGRFINPAEIKLRTPPYEGLLMGRMASAQAAQENYDALKEIAAETGKLIQKHTQAAVEVAERKESGGQVTAIRFQSGYGLSIGRRDDVILLGLGRDAIVNEAFGLLSGSTSAKGMTDSSRFRKAFDQLPPAEDTFVFFDVDRMLSAISGMIRRYHDAAADESQDGRGREGGGDEDSGVAPVLALIRDLAIIDYIAETEWTDGHRTFAEAITVLKQEAGASPLYEVMTGQPPIKDWEKYIPKEAQSFSVSAGLSFSKAYDYVVGFIEKNIHGGKDAVRGFKQALKEWELDPKRDVLDLIQGSFVFVSTGSEWTLLAKVTDEKRTEGQVGKLVKWLSAMLGSALGPQNLLQLKDVDVGAKRDFHELSSPMQFAVGITKSPVYGCTEGYFMVGSSAKAVRRCLETARGERENVTQSKRWRSEALAPDGPVTSISFTDERNWGQEAQEALNVMTMQCAMLPMLPMPIDPEIRDVLTSVAPLLQKTGPVLGKINFYQSSSYHETFDGRQWRMRAVQNYKKPERQEESQDTESR